MATERFANSAQTVLASALDSSSTTVSVGSSMLFPGGGNFRIRIDNELLLVTGVSGTTWTATRGAESTTAAGHSSGAAVVQVLTAAAMNTLTAISADQSANGVFAGPTTGADAAPAFRALVTADLPDDGVTDAKLRNSAAISVIGRSANSVGEPGDIAATNDSGAGLLTFNDSTDVVEWKQGAGVALLDGGTVSLGNAPLAYGGTGASLSGPGADRVLFWDDSAGQVTWLTAGSGLSISGTTLSATGSGGSVTSVALTAPAILSVAGSPVTGSGTLALSLATQSANTVFAGPTSGGSGTPAFRALVAADVPGLSSVYQPLDATLTALAALTVAADSLTVGTGTDAFAQTTFGANTFPAKASAGGLAAKTITDFGLSLVDDADASAARTTLGLGALATQSGTFSGGGTLATGGFTLTVSATASISGSHSGTASGTNTGDQTITLTGNVTGSGTGSFATTIANGAVTLAMQANMASGSLVYRKTAGSGAPEVQTLATLKTDLGLSGTNSGDQTIALTGDVTGSGTGSFAATLATAQPAAHTWALAQTFTVAPAFTDAPGTRTALSLGALAVQSTTPKNVARNGNFNVWQRGTSYTSFAGGYTADGWNVNATTTGLINVTQDTDVPTVAQSGVHSLYSLKITVTSADTSLSNYENVSIGQRIEGYDFQTLAQRGFAISFWVKTVNKTGIFCVALNNGGSDRAFLAEYTVNAANTWEYKTITVPASPSAGTWNYTNGIGLYLDFYLMAGAGFQGTAGSWQSAVLWTTVNQVNGMDSTGNRFFLSQVQVNVGSASVLQPVPFQEELARCQRYYEKGYDYGTAPGTSFSFGADGYGVFDADSATPVAEIHGPEFKVTKRATPTMAIYDGAGTAGKVSSLTRSSGASNNNIAISATYATTTRVMVQINNATAGGLFYGWTASAEL